MYDTDMARRLKALGRQTARPAWYLAECTETSPLTFSIADGNFRFKSGEGLTMTATASGRTWQIGSTAAAILSGGSLLVIDQI